MTDDMRDQGLDYETASHAIQSCIAYELGERYPNGIPVSELVRVVKHLRVGIDLSKGEQRGLAELLIKKKIISPKEYMEHMRLAANEEYARYLDHLRKEYNLPWGITFR